MKRCFVLLVSVLWLSACQPLSVSTQADPYADFSGYRSYDWQPEKQGIAAENPLLIQQLKFVIERELQIKGIAKNDRTPDFLVSYYGSQKQRSTERTIERTDYWGDRGRYPQYEGALANDPKEYWRRPPALRGGSLNRSVETQTIEYKEGTLVIDFHDAKTQQLVWQATLQGVVDEQDPLGQLDKAVVKALQQFPPQP